MNQQDNDFLQQRVSLILRSLDNNSGDKTMIHIMSHNATTPGKGQLKIIIRGEATRKTSNNIQRLPDLEPIQDWENTR